MTPVPRPAHALLAVRLLVAAGLVRRLARGARRPAPLAPVHGPVAGTVSVVVPARDEAGRIGPLLAAVAADTQVDEVVVVDDQSSDGTAAVARAAGARVVAGTGPPPGWAGKAWALQQGIEAATGTWVVCLDADTRPQPGLVGALVGALAGGDAADGEDGGAGPDGAGPGDLLDLVTVGPRFLCDTALERLVHPAMLATLVARFGPPGVPAPAGRTVANGQCTAARRERWLALGAMAPAAPSLVEDVALARHLVAAGHRVAFLDGQRVLDVRMHERGADVWRGWGRSLPLAEVTGRPRLAADLATTWLALALPLPRLALRRGDALDAALLAVRLGVLVATAPSYARRGPAYWCSPLADLPVAVALTRGALRPVRTWRGRTYPTARSGARSAT